MSAHHIFAKSIFPHWNSTLLRIASSTACLSIVLVFHSSTSCGSEFQILTTPWILTNFPFRATPSSHLKSMLLVFDSPTLRKITFLFSMPVIIFWTAHPSASFPQGKEAQPVWSVPQGGSAIQARCNVQTGRWVAIAQGNIELQWSREWKFDCKVITLSFCTERRSPAIT